MAVITHKLDGTILVDGKMESGQDNRAQQPSLEEQREYWRTHTPQPRLQEVEIRPTRRSKPLMEVPAHLRRTTPEKAPAVTFTAPKYKH